MLKTQKKKKIKVNESNPTESRLKILNIFRLLEEILLGPKTNEQSDTDSESEKLDISQGGIPKLDEETEQKG